MAEHLQFSSRYSLLLVHVVIFSSAENQLKHTTLIRLIAQQPPICYLLSHETCCSCRGLFICFKQVLTDMFTTDMWLSAAAINAEIFFRSLSDHRKYCYCKTKRPSRIIMLSANILELGHPHQDIRVCFLFQSSCVIRLPIRSLHVW